MRHAITFFPFKDLCQHLWFDMFGDVCGWAVTQSEIGSAFEFFLRRHISLIAIDVRKLFSTYIPTSMHEKICIMLIAACAATWRIIRKHVSPRAQNSLHEARCIIFTTIIRITPIEHCEGAAILVDSVVRRVVIAIDISEVSHASIAIAVASAECIRFGVRAGVHAVVGIFGVIAVGVCFAIGHTESAGNLLLSAAWILANRKPIGSTNVTDQTHIAMPANSRRPDIRVPAVGTLPVED